MATEEGVVSVAKEVSDSFVKQYYLILSQRTTEARRFYVDSSVVSRPGPDGTMISFNSVEAIDEQFLSGDYENTTFEVLSVDYQSSLETGIFIMVIGFFTGKDNIKRKFSQMFYLVHENPAYLVINDIFRYVDEESSTPKTLPVAESVPATEMVKPADASVENSVNAAEVTNVVAGATLDNGKKHSDEKAVTAKKPTAPVAETVAPQLDGAKRSYRDIARSLATNAAPFQAKFPVQKPKYTGQPSPAATPKAPASVSNFEKRKDQKIIDEPGTSIFVANLPMNAMPPQLFELFKEFGPIKENGIQVRSSSANNGVCFGFVAFESATSVQSVLQAAKKNPFMLADRKLRVKEKEVEYNGSKPSKPAGQTGGGSKSQNGSADGGDDSKVVRNRKNQNGGSADDEDGFIKVVRNRKNQNGGSADGEDGFIKVVRNRKNQNGGSADGGDEVKPIRNRRNNRRNDRRGDRNANGDNNDKKSSEGRGPNVQA
ncbi:Nuclear transport factor 2 [Cardamine amara subsp. amara]|uniref:Nuclear transport factor 2 n=1 Tax=Cardamine amara subsp. amara TaxID=228776 RepID=A0ABD1BMR2_CARAN